VARLFFALWPDADAAQALAALAGRVAEASGGRPMPRDKIHLTLAFLGQVGPAAHSQALAAARFRPRAFEMELDRIGAFRSAGVAWAGIAAPPAELVSLQRKLEERLRARGFALEERGYAPHVTLARRVLRPVMPTSIEPIAWRASAFTLVRSETGSGRYVIEEEWPLRA
jgi:2'-5' RNA ligase